MTRLEAENPDIRIEDLLPHVSGKIGRQAYETGDTSKGLLSARSCIGLPARCCSDCRYRQTTGARAVEAHNRLTSITCHSKFRRCHVNHSECLVHEVARSNGTCTIVSAGSHMVPHVHGFGRLRQGVENIAFRCIQVGCVPPADGIVHAGWLRVGFRDCTIIHGPIYVQLKKLHTTRVLNLPTHPVLVSGSAELKGGD